MSLLTLTLTGVGLAMDAFAVCVAKSICFRKFEWKKSIKMASTFGFFQFLMIVIGSFIGGLFSSFIDKYNTLIVFIVFVALGLKLLYESLTKAPETCEVDEVINFKELTAMGIATSLDALAIGVTYASLPDSMKLHAGIIIGIVTLFISGIGLLLGYLLGMKINSKYAEILGSVALILLGVKVLL
ncbi:manganese efflux pump MntP family protein [Clostridium mediterraneense]|uniref:manganese efflux pump MntP n=1 Tax=Clostridium mediterraneense TaxID=1805472 RepID=UPI00082B3EB7|nr:manganese efflux pump [Clostridium mediterraneense]